MTAHLAEVALLPLAIGVPAGLAAAWLFPGCRSAAVRLAPWAPLPALLLALWPGQVPDLSLPGIFTGLRFGLDALGRSFLLITACLWIAAGLFARRYVTVDPRQPAFFGFWLLTLLGNLALILARDALGFYLWFAVMTFAAYGLIVHFRGEAEFRAGRVYIAMAVLAEGALLSGIFLVGLQADARVFSEIGEAYAKSASPGLLAGLFLVGFGVKAGLVPMHLWLPLAHPVAPAPASALLSGAMIKAGLLGWLRFLPVGEIELATWGALLVSAGILSVFYGVAVGSTQSSPKTVLAYSSVSQMGFMAAGVGIALISPAHAPSAVLAVAIYATHHGLAKGALFLLAGLAPVSGWSGRMRGLAVAGALLPGLALAGAPWTSGAVAKQALKGTLEPLSGAWPQTVALILSLGAVGSFLLLARFYAVLLRDERKATTSPPVRPWLPWAALVAAGTAAPWWLPWAYSPPAGVPIPSPGYGIVDSLWPVILGALLAALLWRLAHRLPRLSRQVVPPGDLLELASFGGRWLARHRPGSPGPWARRLLEPAATRLRAEVDRLTAAGETLDSKLSRGHALGLLVVALVLVLGGALLAPP